MTFQKIEIENFKLESLQSNVVLNQVSENDYQIDVDGIVGEPESWGGTSPDGVKRFIKAIDKAKNKNLVMNLNNCPGGYVGDALLIHEYIKSAGLKSVTTNIAGVCASCATILAQSASPGKRRQSRNSLQLIHRATNWTIGNVNHVKETLSQLEKNDKIISGIYSNRENTLSQEEYMEIMDRNMGNGEWLTPDEALELKLVDEIYDPENKYMMNSIKDQVSNYKLPEIPENKLKTITNFDMENKELNEKITGFEKVLNGLKEKIENFFGTQKPDEKPEVKPEIENSELTNLKTENSSLKEKITGFETEIQNLKDKVSAFETREQEVKDLKEKAEKLVNELTETVSNYVVPDPDQGDPDEPKSKTSNTTPKAIMDEYKEKKALKK